MSKYFCEFTFKLLGHSRDGGRCLTEIPRIDPAINGFWVNADLHYTHASDNVYWIPPAQIHCVKKVLE